MNVIEIKAKRCMIPFCEDTTGKTMKIMCYHNVNPHNAIIKIENTILQYVIPAGGWWYCVMAEDAFVIAFDTIHRQGTDTVFTDSICLRGYRPDDRYGDWYSQEHGERYEFVSGQIRLYLDGHSRNDGFPAPDLVYLENEVGITAKGKLYARNADNVPPNMEFLLGDKDGDYCITSDRHIYKIKADNYYRKPIIKRSEPLPCGIYLRDYLIVDIATSSFGYVAMGSQGELFFSKDGEHWLREPGVTVTAIAARDFAVAAKTGGNIAVYEYDYCTKSIRCREEIKTNARHICELVVLGKKIGWQSSSATFDLLEPAKNGRYKSLRK